MALTKVKGKVWDSEDNGLGVNVKDYGAMGDGNTDDTSAIQSAIDYAETINGIVYFPTGTYKVTSGLTVSAGSSISFKGEGFNNSKIYSTLESGVTLTIGDSSANTAFSFTGIYIAYTGTTSPAPSGTIGLQCSRLVAPSYINNFQLQYFYDSLVIDGEAQNVGNIFISNFQIGNAVSKGISLVNNAQGVWIDTGKIYGSSTCYCLEISDVSAVYASKLDLLTAGTGVFVSSSAGEICTWLFFNNVIADTNTNNGFRFVTSGTGDIRGVIMDGCWSSSNGESGISIDGAATGNLDSFTINNHFAINNGLAGASIGSASGINVNNLSINGGIFSSNNQDDTGYSGIDIAAGQDGFQITGTVCGAISSHTNYQLYGIRVRSGDSDDYIIANNNLAGNVTAPMLDQGTGADKIVSGNTGYLASGEIRTLTGDLTAGSATDFMLNVQNPFDSKAIVKRAIIRVATAGGTASSEGDFGVAASADTLSTNLIDGIDLNAVGIYDNIDDQGTGGNSTQLLDENGGANDWITGQIKTADATSLVGTYYFEIMGV